MKGLNQVYAENTEMHHAIGTNRCARGKSWNIESRSRYRVGLTINGFKMVVKGFPFAYLYPAHSIIVLCKNAAALSGCQAHK